MMIRLVCVQVYGETNPSFVDLGFYANYFNLNALE